MAHFAQINNDNIVTAVIVIDDEHAKDGQRYIVDVCGLMGTWIETCPDGSFRKNYAGLGAQYDPTRDEFIAICNYPSWVLNDSNDWEPPIPKPQATSTHDYIWDEPTVSWIPFLIPDEIGDTNIVILGSEE